MPEDPLSDEEDAQVCPTVLALLRVHHTPPDNFANHVSWLITRSVAACARVRTASGTATGCMVEIVSRVAPRMPAAGGFVTISVGRPSVWLLTPEFSLRYSHPMRTERRYRHVV